jgi:excisionase family DNA binding protein
METNDKTQNENSVLDIATFQSEVMKRLQTIEQQQEELILVRKDVLSFSEAIRYLDLSDSYVYKLTAKRKIPHYKQGKLIYFVREELDRWLTSQRIKTRSELEMEAASKLKKMRV